jgi:superfamily II DNA or RNA helicase
VILEEAHECSSDQFWTVMAACTNAAYRLALTATPFMKDDEEANMRLHAAFGPIGIRVTEELLIERGILAKPYFKIVQLKQKPPKLFKTTSWQAAYRLGIVDNEERNNAIVTEVKEAVNNKLTAMVLVQQKAHGENILAKMTAAGIRAEFIFGEHEQQERQSALNKLKSGSIDALIGSTILDVGVDVPAVGMVVLAGGGKAEVALRQRIGRGLRAKKQGPNVCFIVDFSDHFNTYLHRHAQQRLEIIKTTPGFGENILKLGERFRFH